ncbi:hypothetical protein [Paracoccus sp. 08]|uniref:hypothetical protein n=1 Tax=Paracoccus sp. 08 TaxID=2606624 RepID=UPI0020941F58|nr:hypothetical protein [Paracoccus sp. 08]MCO6362298.1 hypothetical protein [Paracoccus sp. 08]
MSLRGKAFLCIWNDHDPAQAIEYEAWHTFEHVPERVCVPGFLSGRRYADYRSTEGRYFTLYDIASLDVLETAAYRDLQDNPTPWSRKMRTAFRNFERIPCTTIASAGQGCAGAVGTIVIETLRHQSEAVVVLQEQLSALMRDHVITAYHLGVAPTIPQYAVFGTAEVRNDRMETYVIVVEAVLADQARMAVTRLARLLDGMFRQATVQRCQYSDLLFQIGVEELIHSDLRREVHAHHQ